MEHGSNSEDDHSIRQDFPAYGSGSSRDWFSVDKFAADDSSDLMDASPPAANERYYDHENVRLVSDSRHHHQQQNYAQPQTLEIGIGGQIEREHMFDKVVTPSDVGKLNRLVIPKQHAEKFFPLDSSSNEKGLLLNFEDLSGKSWRFRYSYWNSSQSYVMTKGWSRFVKEKKLDAGDIVSFQRGLAAAEKHHLFIDWRRRPITTLPIDMSQFYRSAAAYGGATTSWTPLLLRPPPNRINFQTHNPGNHFYSGYGGANYMGQVVTNNASLVYLTSPEGIGIASGRGRGAGEKIPVVFESSPVVQVKKAANKSLRLFGVNMECPVSSDTSTSDEFKILLSSMAIPVNSSTPHLNQHPSSSTLLLPSSTRMYSGAPVSNKGKTSMSLNLDI